MTALDESACSVHFSTDAHTEYDVCRFDDSRLIGFLDHVAEEVPIAMVYNGLSHAVMLATPKDLQDFALGFSMSEGILDDRTDLYGVESIMGPDGIALQLDISSRCFARLKSVRRSMTGRTGCGLCGTESLEKALRLPEINDQALSTLLPKLSRDAIAQGLHQLQQQQPLQALTGATHACAWMNLAGELIVIREDVGRHNALDKLIGALQATLFEPSQGFVMTTSRASVEMVQKAIAAGVSLLVAISAPTGLAIRIANMYGLTLVGFARQNRFVVYSHPARIEI